MGITEQNIGNNHEENNDKDYVKDLFFKIKTAFEKQEDVTFRIVEAKEKGFVVKVGGLYAYISFAHLSWTYPNADYWKNAATSLVDCFFSGKIHSLSENPISILLDARNQQFETPMLDKYRAYRGVILQKSGYGFFVDLGVHFKWKYGSLLGLLHKTALQHPSDFENWNAGDNIEIIFQGINDKGQIILSNNRDRNSWLNGEIDTLIGTTQQVTVTRNDSDHLSFKVLGKYNAGVPMLKAFYPNTLPEAKKYLNNLQNEQIIYCEVVKINKKRDGLVLRLLINGELS
jgi:ribosomal protein S1